MVRDKFDAQSEKQNAVTETQHQSQNPRERSGPEGAEQAESDEPTESQLDLLQWNKLLVRENPEEEAQPWPQVVTGAEADKWPTHLRTFSSPEEYKLVKHTYQQLLHSGYYWGPLTMDEAHEILSNLAPGTFLIRDSGQTDVLFTLSYQSSDGPTSVRVMLNNLQFSLYGSHKTFESLFVLLSHYTSSSCKLTVPHRKHRPERLKQICRRAFIRIHGEEGVRSLPGLSKQVKDYVHAYPYSI